MEAEQEQHYPAAAVSMAVTQHYCNAEGASAAFQKY